MDSLFHSEKVPSRLSDERIIKRDCIFIGIPPEKSAFVDSVLRPSLTVFSDFFSKKSVQIIHYFRINSF